MKETEVAYKNGFHVLLENMKSQSASMVLEAGEKTGGPDNKHKESDQWLYVVSGEGKAIIEEKEVKLQEGSLVLIEAGETHEIQNKGNTPLRTLNFYVPPEY